MNGLSLFSSAGIGELLFPEIGIDIVVANELIKKRADLYSAFHPTTKMIVGDISDGEIQEQIIANIDKNVKFLTATPPCQGLSTLGKNKYQEHYEKDSRNYLVFEVLKIIDASDFDFILFENVPKFIDMYFPFDGKVLKLQDILEIKYADDYIIESRVLDSKDYGVPQTRPRAVIKIYKKGKTWPWPVAQNLINLEDAIGHLPVLKHGEGSTIKYHEAKKISDRIILALEHTPSGCSALQNPVHFPKKENGDRIKGFHNTYKRMHWDQPAHARTTYNGSVSSHNNVHPGRPTSNGKYSDPRVLSLLETFIVSTIPSDIELPDWVTDTFIRTVIGEGVPPKFLLEITKGVFK